MVQRTLIETQKKSPLNRIQKDRDLVRSLWLAPKKHLPVVKFTDEKVVCTPSNLFLVTAEAQFLFKVTKQGKQSTGEHRCNQHTG